MMFFQLRNSISLLCPLNTYTLLLNFSSFVTSPLTCQGILSYITWTLWYSHHMTIITFSPTCNHLYICTYPTLSFVFFMTAFSTSNNVSINNQCQICDEQIHRSILLITRNSKEFNVCNLKLAMNKEIRMHFYFPNA